MTLPFEARTRALNDHAIGQTGCVIYVMARDQRVRDNHALATAQAIAKERSVPLLVTFCLQPATGFRAREHYQFVVDGLQAVERDLATKQVGFHLMIGPPRRKVPALIKRLQPAAVVFDMSPLRGPQRLHHAVADEATVAVYEVDTHNVVPVWQASDKLETGARTLRPRIHRQLADRLQDDVTITKQPQAYTQSVQSLKYMQSKIDTLLKQIEANGTDISRFKPGERAAQAAIDSFIERRLEAYAEARNDPAVDGQSELNPWLHYGQLYAGRVVAAVEQAAQEDGRLRQGADAVIEEMVVRKELADNFCFYNPNYDKLRGAPQWAQKTLEAHKDDERPHTYTRQQFDDAQTHDDAWNAAQNQLRQTGKIHGYMRMYWAKKVLEWSNTPQGALETLLYLNDRYHIDGGDPNGYVGILWSIAGLHDRPWFERPVYGQVRYMNANGLKRKFKIDQYIDRFVSERVGLDS